MANNSAVLSGALPSKLGNDLSEALHAAMSKGMETDEAVCIAIAVACDYGRGTYGDEYIEDMVAVLRAQRGKPLPQSV